MTFFESSSCSITLFEHVLFRKTGSHFCGTCSSRWKTGLLQVCPGRSAVARGHIILGFSFEDGLVLQAIIARETAHQRTVRPMVEDAADIFPRGACHGRKLALGDLLLNNNAALADVTTELIGKAQQRARNASLDGKKARGCHDVVGEAQTVRQQSGELTVELWPRLPKRLEGGAADEAQLRIAQRNDRSRARCPIDHGQLADDGAGAEYCEDALATSRLGDARFEQALVDPIAPIAFIARPKQSLIGCKRERASLGEQTVRQFRRQSGQQTFRPGDRLRHRAPPLPWLGPVPQHWPALAGKPMLEIRPRSDPLLAT